MEGPPAKKSKLSPTGDAQDLWTIVSDVESKLPEELGNIKTSYDIPSTDENGDASRIHDAGMDAISSNILSGDIVVTINSQDNPFSNVFPASQNAAHNPSDGLSSTTVTSVLQQQQHMMRQPLQQHLLIAQTRQMLNSSQPQLVTILPPSSVSLPGQMQRFQIHMSSGNNHSNARMLQLPLVINNNNNILNANNLLASNNNDMNNFGTPCGSNQVQPQNRQNVMTIMVPGRSGNQVSLSQQIMLNGNIMTANQGSWSSNNTANGNGIQQPIAGSTPLVVMDNNTSQARLVTVPSRLQKLVLISTVGNATPNSNSLSVSNSNNFVHNQTNMIGHTLINNDTVPRLKFPPAQQNQLQQLQQTIQQPVLINNAVLDQQQQNFLQTSTSVGGQMSLPSTSNLNASHAITSTPLQPQSSATAPPNRSSGITDPNKQNLIRQQLVLLLHAHKCQKRDLSQNGIQGTSACKMPHCETMKKVLRHMAECRDGKICKIPHCASSRQIITHYKNCPRNGCSVCMPIKNNLNPTTPPVATSGNVIIGSAGSSVLSSAPNVSQNVQQHPQQLVQQQTHQGLVKAYMALGLTQQQIYQQTIAQHQEQQTCNGVNLHIGPNSLSANSSELADFGNINGASGGSGSSSRAASQLGSTDSAPVKEWHKSITQDLRNHLVHKLVQAIFPTPDPDILKDVRIKNLVQYSRKVEGDMYETANTREEYYHLLAAKIYRIQKELEEKKMKRSQLENQQLQQTQLHNSIRFPATNSRQPMPNGPSNSQPRQPNIQGTTRNSTPVPNILVSNNQAAPSPNFLTSSPQQQLQDILMKHQRIDQQSPQSRMFQASTWPSNHATTTSAPMSSPAQMGSSGFLSPTSGFMSPSAGNSDLSALFATDTIKKEPGSQPPVEAQTSVKMEDVSMGDSSCTKDAIKTESVLTSFGSASKVCQSKEMQKDKVMLDIKADDGFADPNNDLLLHPTSSSSSSSITPINKTVWKPNELRQYLLPTLEKLYRLDESLPFRQPVDPVVLQIPDYFDIIKNPMDLSTIKKNLDSGGYSDPWQYVEDVWLMFENAWLYNRKTSRVHKFSTKLSEVFEPEIDGVMRSLGFCCGRKYVFSPQALCCYGKTMCTIPINAVYYSHQNRYVFCEKCFLETEGDEMELNEDPMQPNIRIKKELFEKTKNNQLEMEPFVECSYCGKKQHQICSLYLESVWQGPFVCMSCSATNNVKRKENRYTSKRLPQTKLGTYLENRVNSFLKKNGCGAGEVTIRVLSSSEKTVEVKPAMKLRHGEDIADSFPYTAKSIFAFEEIDGVSVCFFGMHVQEYGSNCPQPNARRIYIAYLDSVNFFQPKAMRTPVYHEILIGYLDYVKKLGYATAHIWACPPSEGDDYIFHCHPPDMKIPKPKRLQDWYKKMLDKAILERIVVDYKDILRDAIENNLSSAIELPYFEGDFWPTVLEDSIKEVEIEEDRKRKESENEALSIAVSLSSSSASSSCSMFGTTTMNSISFPDTSMMDDQNSMDVDDGNMSGGAESSQSGKKKGQKSAVKKKNSKNKGGSSGSASSKKTGNKKNQPPRIEAANGNELTTKLFQMMEKHKEVFFVVKLHPVQNIPALPHIQDPDQYVSNDLMDGRDAFLMMSRERHYEFSSLRRAKFSTLVMLYELHTQGREAFGYSCNNCKANIETHYHCTVCEDFDLCVSCYEKLNHLHKMEKRSLDLDGSGPGGSSGLGGIAGGNGGGIGSGEGSSDGSNLVNPQEARRHSIQKCIQSLLHACTCRDANCRLASCQKMKRVMNHTKLCKRKQTNNCPVCKQLFALCWYHAKHCRESKCQVPFCLNFKQKLQQQQTQQKMQQAMLMRRRIEAMLQNGSGTGSSLSSSSSSSLQAHHQSIPQKLTSVGNVVPASPSTHQAALTNRLILHQQQLQQQQQQQQFQQIQVMDSSQASISNGGGSQQIIGALISSDSNSQMSTLKLQLQQPLVVQHGDVPQSTANTMWIEGIQHQQDAMNILMTTASSTSLASNFSVVTAATTQLIGAPLNSRPVPSSPLSVEKQRKLLNLFQSNPQLLHALLKQKQQQQQQQQQPFAAPSVSLLNQQQQQIQDQQDQNLVMKQQQTRLLLNPRLQTGMNNPRVLMPTFKQPQHIRLAQQSVPSSMIRLPPNDQLILQSSNNVNIQHSQQQQQLVKMQHYHPALNNVTTRAATNPLLRSQLQQQQIVQRMTATRLNIPVSLGLNSSSLQHQASANNSRVIGSTTSAPIMLLMNNNEQVDGQQTRPDQVMLTQLHTDLPSTNAPSSSNTNSHGYGDPNSAVVIPQDQLSRYADQL